MFTPWRELKDAELAMLSDRKLGVVSSAESWTRLSDLFARCSTAKDANMAVCWHGVAALLAERDGEFDRALRHRQIEIEKILWLQGEEIRNPTSGYQTQDYEESDLALRREIVAQLERLLKSSV